MHRSHLVLVAVDRVWPPGHEPSPPPADSGRGAVPTRLCLGQAKHQRPQLIKELAFELAPSQWQTIEWRESSSITLRSRLARIRARAAHRKHLRHNSGPKNGFPSSGPKATRSR